MNKLTKIVATIGPASSTEETLSYMVEAGMNVARFNTKHADPKWHDEHIKRVLQVSEKLDTPVAILVDLQGPEIRVDLPEKKSFEVKKNEEVTFTDQTENPKPKTIFVPEMVIESLSIGDQIMLEDGAAEFVVTAKEPHVLSARAIDACSVNDRKTMNTPGVILNMPSLTARDFAYLDHIDPKNVDFVGLSFVRNKRDVEILRNELDKRNFTAAIISKIENQSAIDHIDEIIEISDAIMVARGDLGVEVPYPQLIHWQKTIIAKCRTAAKPVITATEMLESMIEKPRPTRAEVSDVAHAVYDGTDAVMLSGETTAGKYPVKAVATQATIAEYNEPFANPLFEYPPNFDRESAVSLSAISILENSSIEVDKIICLSETGQTARLLSRFHPKVPIIALTSNHKTLKELVLSYGVVAHRIDLEANKLKTYTDIIDQCREHDLVSIGETILLVYGTTWKKPGLTNSLTIMNVE